MKKRGGDRKRKERERESSLAPQSGMVEHEIEVGRVVKNKKVKVN
jgi:hypothetical protein